MLNPVCEHAQRKRLGTGDHFFPRLSVGQNTRKRRHFRNHASIFFLIKFYNEVHFVYPKRNHFVLIDYSMHYRLNDVLCWYTIQQEINLCPHT